MASCTPSLGGKDGRPEPTTDPSLKANSGTSSSVDVALCFQAWRVLTNPTLEEYSDNRRLAFNIKTSLPQALRPLWNIEAAPVAVPRPSLLVPVSIRVKMKHEPISVAKMNDFRVTIFEPLARSYFKRRSVEHPSWEMAFYSVVAKASPAQVINEFTTVIVSNNLNLRVQRVLNQVQPPSWGTILWGLPIVENDTYFQARKFIRHRIRLFCDGESQPGLNSDEFDTLLSACREVVTYLDRSRQLARATEQTSEPYEVFKTKYNAFWSLATELVSGTEINAETVCRVMDAAPLCETASLVQAVNDKKLLDEVVAKESYPAVGWALAGGCLLVAGCVLLLPVVAATAPAAVAVVATSVTPACVAAHPIVAGVGGVFVIGSGGVSLMKWRSHSNKAEDNLRFCEQLRTHHVALRRSLNRFVSVLILCIVQFDVEHSRQQELRLKLFEEFGLNPDDLGERAYTRAWLQQEYHKLWDDFKIFTEFFENIMAGFQ